MNIKRIHLIFAIGIIATILGCQKTEPQPKTILNLSSPPTPAVNSADTNNPSDPFGLKKGMTYEQLKASIPLLVNTMKYIYMSGTTIRPNPHFVIYSYFVTQETGLCGMWAASTESPNNDFGDQLKAEYKEVEGQLTEKYGPGFETDSLQPGSIWNKPNDYMHGLQKEERTKRTVWNADTHHGPLPNNIKAIVLEAHAPAFNKGKLTLTYGFDNIEQCTAIQQGRQTAEGNL